MPTRRRQRAAAQPRNPTAHAALGLVPVAISLLAGGGHAPASLPSGAPTARRATITAAKEFSVPLSNLSDWAKNVVVTMKGITIEGHSPVHPVASDCEMHLGGHSPNFSGNPDGLVLEPMNACADPFPGKSQQNNGDWTAFGDSVVGTTITASGVPRIWPEHLNGGAASNPNHAVELHPLLAVVSNGRTFDFSQNVSAGAFTGGLSEATAFAILENTTVEVTNNGSVADISFHSGTIGNFTVLTLQIDPASITDDGAGSFRMNATVQADSPVQVRAVTAKGSPINDAIRSMRSGRSTNLESLVLFSLSPEALLRAANQSSGSPVSVDQPIQLILYGAPD